MKISKIKLGILFILAIVILIESVSFAAYQTVEQKDIESNQEQVSLNEEEEKILDLINEYRRKNGLSELKPIFNLQKVAKIKAEDLLNNNYFAHTSPVLGTPFEMLKNNNIDYKIAGENLAGNITPEKAVEAWINSRTHRENILEEKFAYTGICAIDSPIYGRIYVQLFLGA